MNLRGQLDWTELKRRGREADGPNRKATTGNVDRITPERLRQGCHPVDGTFLHNILKNSYETGIMYYISHGPA
jgi:hypothetical protein